MDQDKDPDPGCVDDDHEIVLYISNTSPSKVHIRRLGSREPDHGGTIITTTTTTTFRQYERFS